MGVLMVWQIGSGGTQDKKGWETLRYATTAGNENLMPVPTVLNQVQD